MITNVTFISPQLLRVTIPSGTTAGVYYLGVMNPDERISFLMPALTIRNPQPVVSSITPASGYWDETVNFTLAGNGFAAIKPISIDYAVLEKHPDVAVIEADFEWSDVGSWNAIPPLIGADGEGNAAIGAAHVGLDSRGVLIVGEPGELVATIGLEDVVVVRAGNATLVCRKDRVEDVKKVHARLEAEGRRDVL